MVFQSLLSSSISSSFHSSVNSLRSGLGQIGTNNSPPKSFDLSAWRTFDRVSVQDGNCSSREQVMERSAVVVGKKPAECTGWEGYLVQAERRCTEELCDWQDESEIAPFWRPASNYGTFSRPRVVVVPPPPNIPPTQYAAAVAAAAAAAAGRRPDSADNGGNPAAAAAAPAAGAPAPAGATGGKGGEMPRAAAAGAAALVEHVVQPGDTVSRLALQYRVSADDIMSANRLFGGGQAARAALAVRRVIYIPAAAPDPTRPPAAPAPPRPEPPH